MVRFECHGVGGGWDQAVYGPPDQVDYTLSADGEQVLHAYDSVHTFLRLYECADRERTTHHAFTGFDLDDRGEALALELHGARVRTTYDDLAGALEPFLGSVFAELDDAPADREAHIADVERNADVTLDLRALHDRFRAGSSPAEKPTEGDDGEAPR